MKEVLFTQPRNPQIGAFLHPWLFFTAPSVTVTEDALDITHKTRHLVSRGPDPARGRNSGTIRASILPISSLQPNCFEVSLQPRHDRLGMTDECPSKC